MSAYPPNHPLTHYDNHKAAAHEAMRAFSGMWDERMPVRVPGMDTVIRLAVRISCGKTIEEAAAKEYLYRWSLALRSPIFGVPHTMGM